IVRAVGGAPPPARAALGRAVAAKARGSHRAGARQPAGAHGRAGGPGRARVRGADPAGARRRAALARRGDAAERVITLGRGAARLIPWAPMSDVTEALAKIHVFKDLHRDGVERIAAVCSEESYRLGEVIFKEGDVGDKLYLILEGKV